MTTTNTSRDKVLNRIRTSISTVALDNADLGTAYSSLPRLYVRTGSLSEDARIALLMERLRDYDADVVEATPTNLIDTIAGTLRASGCASFIAPAGLPKSWLAPGFNWVIDCGLDHEVEKVEAVVTAATCAIADSGTIVLHHSPSEGRRVLSLLPDWHLCILLKSQVVETLPEYFARVTQPPALVTWISGPSATADIEMTRIKGVHGPRHLSVILLQD